MNRFNNNDQQFLSQLTTLFLLSVEGMITESQFQQLNQLLGKNPVARDYYYDFIASYVSIKSLEMFAETDSCRLDYLNQCLEELARDEIQSPAVEMPKAPKDILPNPKIEIARETRRFSRFSLASVIVSAAAVLFVVLFVHFAPVRGNALVGKCLKTVQASGESELGEIFSGCDLYAGPVTLTEGLLELELTGGTNVIVEAPAEFTLKSASRIKLQKGRLVVKINEQSEEPFVVSSANASIVDYGTEFGVQVDASGNTLTHVYQGKVELRAGSDPLRPNRRMPLVQDQGGLAGKNGQLVSQKGLAGKFIRRQEFETRALALAGSAYHRWLAYSYQLRRDPGLVAYYTFEQDQNDPTRLVNVANETSGLLNGVLSSADQTTMPQWTDGRWPETTALSFDRSQKQYVEVPSDPALGINGPVTIAAWVDCSGSEDGGHIVSNRVDSRGLCNYQFGYRSPSMRVWRKGMHLARKSDSGDAGNQMCSKVLPDPEGWTLIAATHDNNTLKFYVDGKLVDTQSWPHRQELGEGGLMIGWDFSPNDSSRFNGKIAEIVIAKRVFTDSEMTEMYQAGKPE